MHVASSERHGLRRQLCEHGGVRMRGVATTRVARRVAASGRRRLPCSDLPRSAPVRAAALPSGQRRRCCVVLHLGAGRTCAKIRSAMEAACPSGSPLLKRESRTVIPVRLRAAPHGAGSGACAKATPEIPAARARYRATSRDIQATRRQNALAAPGVRPACGARARIPPVRSGKF
jgi:hypothetical protein